MEMNFKYFSSQIGYAPKLSDKLMESLLSYISQRVFIRIRTQQCIQVLHPTKIRTDRNVLDRTPVLVHPFGFVPRTAILFPGDAPQRTRQVNIHVRAFELLDWFPHSGFVSRHIYWWISLPTLCALPNRHCPSDSAQHQCILFGRKTISSSRWGVE